MRFLLALTYGLVLAVCLVDYLVGAAVGLSVFYFFPVCLAAYYVSRSAGIVVALVCGLKKLWTDLAALGGSSMSLAGYLNILTFSASLVFIALLAATLRAALETEKKEANSDFLTGAANFRAFFRLVDREMARARRYRHPLSIAYLDIDNFKAVNDTRGHGAGDDLLALVAETLRRNLRETDTVARLGGDEFAILMPETEEHGARIAVEKAGECLRRAVREGEYAVSFSVGVLTCHEPPPTVDALIGQADQLAYDAKRDGKGQTRYATLG